ncbi:hypothetical protein GCM10009560_40270 [Nonomuraea longicatena]|uniref:Amidohydrolase-related domain-containing protein n=1 Tax=Nonomuraea longicatena TaxID=83682 RepID=A0ABN1PV52_9ACTN
MEAAHAAGLLALAHVTTQGAAELAVEAGVDGLTHMFMGGEGLRPLAERMAAADVFVISTLALYAALSGWPPPASLDGRIATRLNAPTRAALGRPPAGFPELPGAGTAALATAEVLHLAGVTLLAGTDANDGPGRPFPTVHGAGLHLELERLTSAGLTPAEALSAATSVPAARFGLRDRGLVRAGHRADLLLAEGNPTTDITATRSITAVWQQGVRIV